MMILVPPCSDNDASLLFNSIQHFLLMGWDDGKYDEEQLFVPQYFCFNLDSCFREPPQLLLDQMTTSPC